MLWVMLSTAQGGDAGKLRVHERELRRRVERKTGVRGIEYVCVDTSEGNGTLHLLWAGNGSLYVEQKWLSEQWDEIHGARIVWVRRYRYGSRGRLSRYMVSQYMSGQRGAGMRISWSWKATMGLPLKRAWRTFKVIVQGTFRELLEKWEAFLRDEHVELREGVGAYRPLWAGANVRLKLDRYRYA